MTSRVAIAEFDGDVSGSLRRAIELIGGIADLNIAERTVVVKVGVFSHKEENHASVDLVDAIVDCFDRSPRVFLAESNNYRGTGSERLQLWKEVFSDRVVPFNLSDDPDTRKVRLASQEMNLSHILFKPNVLVSTHIMRSFEGGSILKNLFGCILDSKRVKYHKVLPTLLADVYERIGGVDLAVLDGTHFWQGAGGSPVPMNTLVVGRDAVAVETIGATLAGLTPQKMPIIQEFVNRGLGEGNLENIEVVGASLESLKEKFVSATMTQKKLNKQRQGPQTWGGQAWSLFEALMREGFFEHPHRRTMEDVIRELENRGLLTEGKEDKISSSIARRVKKGVLKKTRDPQGWVYWKE